MNSTATFPEKELSIQIGDHVLSDSVMIVAEIGNNHEGNFNTAKKFGARDITLLYCVSNYPSKSLDFNLNNIKILKKKFKCRVGLSDHSKGEKVAVAAIAAGAEVIEKHIALENQKSGLDIEFSLKGKENLSFLKVSSFL